MRRDVESKAKEYLDWIHKEIMMIENFDLIESVEEYIRLLLKELSIYNAQALYFHSKSQAVPTSIISSHTDMTLKIFNFQLQKSVNKSNNLTFSEMTENFQFWKAMKSQVLNSFIVKEFFATRCLVEHFINDQRWNMVLGEISYKLARTTLSFLDLETYQKQDLVYSRDLPVVSHSLDIVIHIHEWAAEECLKIFALDTSNSSLCFRVINLLYMASLLYSLKKEESKRSSLLVRIEALRERLNASQRLKKGMGRVKQLASDLTLEELLKQDKHFDL